MSKLFMIANNLPIEVKLDKEEILVEQTIGGYPTGLKNFYESHDMEWIGRTGLNEEDITENSKQRVAELLDQKKCIPVYLENEIKKQYLEGFCNKTIWPLFHYFTQNTIYDKDYWNAYKKVNQIFAEVVTQYIKDDDILWIHDYHLFLLPALIRKVKPNISIGFFLHIPFPSFEIFRLLPWRTEILEGLLGADLIGFHTYDYERHFMSCIRRLLGYESFFNRIRMEERITKIDAFPRGIDFDLFQKVAKEIKSNQLKKETVLHNELKNNFLKSEDRKVILSIDRLDYAKGIKERLKSYELFLKTYPEYHERISLLLFVVPSRESLDDYQDLKKQLDELVGRINGRFGVINWMPIWYFYRTLEFEEMVELYSTADIALLTPLRDGMNLIAKEFIASRIDSKGVIILSEMAGAAKELSEAIIVNPNNWTEVAEAIVLAFNMTLEEQIERNSLLQRRLKKYNEERWANDFVNSILSVKKLQQTKLTKKVTGKVIDKFVTLYKQANKRMIFLDYDGTLTGFFRDPKKARPNEELYRIINKLIKQPNNTVVVISGRDKETLSEWFSEQSELAFIAEHGVWNRDPGGEWKMTEKIDKSWMDIIRPILEYYVDRTPRTFIEKKNYSLVWHYRDADPDLGTQRSWELKEDLKILSSNLNLEIMDGDKVIEIKNSGINKGRSALNKMGNDNYDFIFAIGDDWTDEYTFNAMPETAITVKVGTKTTAAKYYIDGVPEVRDLLNRFE